MPPAFLVSQFTELYALLLGELPRVGGAGVRISSWYRDRARNAACGGHPRSQHLIGWAIDLVPPRSVNQAALRALGLTVVDEGDHVHVQIVRSGVADALVARLAR